MTRTAFAILVLFFLKSVHSQTEKLDPVRETAETTELLWINSIPDPYPENTPVDRVLMYFNSSRWLTFNSNRELSNNTFTVKLIPGETLAKLDNAICKDSSSVQIEEYDTVIVEYIRVWFCFVVNEVEECHNNINTFYFEFSAIDDNTRTPYFNTESLTVQIESDWDITNPLNSGGGQEIIVRDLDLSHNPISTEISEGSDMFRIEVVPMSDPVGVCGTETDEQYWEHKIQVFANEGFENQNDQYVLEFTVSDGENTSEQFTFTVDVTAVTQPTTETEPTPTTEYLMTTTEERTSSTEIETTTVVTTAEPTTSNEPTTEKLTTMTPQQTTTDSDQSTTLETTLIPTTIITTTTPSTTTTTTTTQQPINPGGVLCSRKDPYGKQWHARAGTTASMPCPNGDKGQAFWVCQLNGEFEGSTPDLKGCSTPWIGDISEEIRSQSSFSSYSASEILSKAGRTIKQALDNAMLNPDAKNEGEFYGHEMLDLLDSLETLLAKTNITNYDSAKTLTVASVAIADKLTKYGRTWEQFNQTEKDQGFTKILNLTQRSAGPLVQQALKNENTCKDEEENCSFSTSIVEENIQIQAGFVTNGEINFFPGGLGKSSTPEPQEGKDTFLKLPQQDGDRVGFIASSFAANTVHHMNSAIYGNPDGSKVHNSELISLTLVNGSNGGVEQYTKLSEPVEITFHHDRESWGDVPRKVRRKLHENERPRGVTSTGLCAYWDPRNLVWSTNGCELVASSQFSTTCRCYHLTSFNMLMNVHDYVGKSQAMLIITYIGIGILAVPLLLDIFSSSSSAIISDSSRSEKEKLAAAGAAVQKYLQFGICCAYAVVFFLVDRNYFYINEDACYATGLVVHFLVLALFSFMSIECVLLVHYTTKSAGASGTSEVRNATQGRQGEKTSFLQAVIRAILKWVVPLLIPTLIVTTTVIVERSKGPNTRAYGGDFCFLDGSYVWAFFIPLFIILGVTSLICLYFYFFSSAADAQAVLTRALVRHTLLMYTLVLLAWIIGLFQLGPYYMDSEMLSYGFMALMAGQGLLLNQFSAAVSGGSNEGNILQRIPNALGTIFGTNQNSGTTPFSPFTAFTNGNDGLNVIPSSAEFGIGNPQTLGLGQYTGMNGGPLTSQMGMGVPGVGAVPQNFFNPAATMTSLSSQSQEGAPIHATDAVSMIPGAPIHNATFQAQNMYPNLKNVNLNEIDSQLPMPFRTSDESNV